MNVIIDEMSAKYFGMFYAENLIVATQTKVIFLPDVCITYVM